MSETDNDAVFDAVATARFTGLAISTLAKLRCMGGGPEYLKLGRKVAYRRSDVVEWLNLLRVSNTAEAALSLPRRLTDACSKVTEGRAGK